MGNIYFLIKLRKVLLELATKYPFFVGGNVKNETFAVNMEKKYLYRHVYIIHHLGPL